MRIRENIIHNTFHNIQCLYLKLNEVFSNDDSMKTIKTAVHQQQTVKNNVNSNIKSLANSISTLEALDINVEDQYENSTLVIRSISEECLRSESSVNRHLASDAQSMSSILDSRSDSILGNYYLKPLKRRDTNNISLVPADYSISDECPLKTGIETVNGSRLNSRRSSSVRKGSIRSSNMPGFGTLSEYPTNFDENIEVRNHI